MHEREDIRDIQVVEDAQAQDYVKRSMGFGRHLADVVYLYSIIREPDLSSREADAIDVDLPTLDCDDLRALPRELDPEDTTLARQVKYSQFCDVGLCLIRDHLKHPSQLRVLDLLLIGDGPDSVT
jgi:hypothetical protein